MHGPLLLILSARRGQQMSEKAIGTRRNGQDDTWSWRALPKYTLLKSDTNSQGMVIPPLRPQAKHKAQLVVHSLDEDRKGALRTV